MASTQAFIRDIGCSSAPRALPAQINGFEATFYCIEQQEVVGSGITVLCYTGVLTKGSPQFAPTRMYHIAAIFLISEQHRIIMDGSESNILAYSLAFVIQSKDEL